MKTFIPMDAVLPSTVTFPSSIRRSASRREQIPASLRYLFKRIPLSVFALSFIFFKAKTAAMPDDRKEGWDELNSLFIRMAGKAADWREFEKYG